MSRLQQYYELWSNVNESKLYKLDEVLDLNAKIKKVNNREWYFWVDNDLYIVKIYQKGKSYYHLSFIYNDPMGNSISSITDKHTPFNVMNGVATVMKSVIDDLKLKIIEYWVFAERKKIDMFLKVTKYILNKHKDVFGCYTLNYNNINMPYELPDGSDKLKGMEIRLEEYKE